MVVMTVIMCLATVSLTRNCSLNDHVLVTIFVSFDVIEYYIFEMNIHSKKNKTDENGHHYSQKENYYSIQRNISLIGR